MHGADFGHRGRAAASASRRGRVDVDVWLCMTPAGVAIRSPPDQIGRSEGPSESASRGFDAIPQRDNKRMGLKEALLAGQSGPNECSC
jgi:hypothetical protein